MRLYRYPQADNLYQLYQSHHQEAPTFLAYQLAPTPTDERMALFLTDANDVRNPCGAAGTSTTNVSLATQTCLHIQVAVIGSFDDRCFTTKACQLPPDLYQRFVSKQV